MSGSRDSGDNTRIKKGFWAHWQGEIERTLAYWFHEVTVLEVSPRIRARAQLFQTKWPDAVYGGMVSFANYPTHLFPLGVSAVSQPLMFQSQPHVTGELMLGMDANATLKSAHKLDLNVTLIPSQVLGMSDCQLLVQPQQVADLALSLPLVKDTGNLVLQTRGKDWGFTTLTRPISRWIQVMSTKLAKAKKKDTVHQLPIERKPIGPHRFSEAKRQYFTELLAQRAQCSVRLIQLMMVYDRLLIPMYQSMQPSPSGSLLCYLKPPAQWSAQGNTTAWQYLVIGKRITVDSSAGKPASSSLMVLVPASDVESLG